MIPENIKKQIEERLKQEMNRDYKLVPFNEITDEARLLAIAWVDGYEYQGMDIPGKQKLASDIMNYARRHCSFIIKEKDKEIERLKGLIGRMYNEFIRAAENTSPAVSENNWQQFKKENNL